MKLKGLLSGNKKNLIIGALWIIAFLILFPNFVQVVSQQMAPYTENEVVITNTSYHATLDGEDNLIAAQLFQPAPKFGNQTYPAIISCHGWLFGLGKESMQRWNVELAKRGFVVMSIDLPGQGMSIGEKDILPRNDIEPIALKDGISYLKSLEFVDDENIGLIGISYGGATVSMSAGVLGDLVDATISLNGFMNFTHWLINGILPGMNVAFTVDKEYITLEKAGDTIITKDNLVELLEFYKIYRGSEEDLKDLIVPGTTKLDRTFLKKFDAVEYLPNVRDDSILFLDAKRQGTFDHTNQSKKGYEAVINSGKQATYIQVDDNHQLMGDPEYTSDYIIINFFEEKLKQADIGNGFASDYDKYTQKRDIQLTMSYFFGFELLYVVLGLFFLSVVPFFIIVNIIYYNKKVATERAEKEREILKKRKEHDLYIDFSFGRGSYWKTYFFTGLTYFSAYLAIWGMSLGFFSELIAGMLGITFYFAMYLAFYFLPDKAEVELWEELKGTPNPYKTENTEEDVKIFDVNALIIMIIILIPVIISTIIGAILSPRSTDLGMPIEQIITPMLYMGAILVSGGIFLIYYLERSENEGITFQQIDWRRFTLDKYGILKNFTFGSFLFLNFIFQWNIWAFFMKFPMTMGPHSWYYGYLVVATALFFGGMQLIIKIFKEKILKDNIQVNREDKLKDILIELFATAFGIVIYVFVVGVAFLPVLTTSLLPNLTWALITIFIVIFLVTSVMKIFCTERGVFGYSIFLPILIFSILAYFLHV